MVKVSKQIQKEKAGITKISDERNSFVEKLEKLVGLLASILPMMSATMRLHLLTIGYQYFAIYIIVLIFLFWFIKNTGILLAIILVQIIISGWLCIYPVKGEVTYNRYICYKPGDSNVTIRIWNNDNEWNVSEKEKMNIYANGEIIDCNSIDKQSNRFTFNLDNQPHGLCSLRISANDDVIEFKNKQNVYIGSCETFHQLYNTPHSKWDQWAGYWGYDYANAVISGYPSKRMGGAFLSQAFLLNDSNNINIEVGFVKVLEKEKPFPTILLCNGSGPAYKFTYDDKYKLDCSARVGGVWQLLKSIQLNVPKPDIDTSYCVLCRINVSKQKDSISIINRVTVNKYSDTYKIIVQNVFADDNVIVAVGTEYPKSRIYIEYIKWCVAELKIFNM